MTYRPLVVLGDDRCPSCGEVAELVPFPLVGREPLTITACCGALAKPLPDPVHASPTQKAESMANPYRTGSPHIRSERLTRERHGLAGNEKELPAEVGEAHCGVSISGEWFFQNVDHAINSIQSGLVACPLCCHSVVSCLAPAGETTYRVRK